MKLTQEHIDYVIRVTLIQNPKEAVEYFAKLMMLEDIRPRHMPELVSKLIAKERIKK